MKTVGSDHEVKAALFAICKSDVHTFLILAQACYLVGEQDLARIFDRVEDEPRKIAARERDVSPARQLPENAGTESGNAPAAIIDDAQFLHVIASRVHFGQQPHLSGDLIAKPPKLIT